MCELHAEKRFLVFTEDEIQELLQDVSKDSKAAPHTTQNPPSTEVTIPQSVQSPYVEPVSPSLQPLQSDVYYDELDSPPPVPPESPQDSLETQIRNLYFPSDSPHNARDDDDLILSPPPVPDSESPHQHANNIQTQIPAIYFSGESHPQQHVVLKTRTQTQYTLGSNHTGQSGYKEEHRISAAKSSASKFNTQKATEPFTHEPGRIHESARMEAYSGISPAASSASTVMDSETRRSTEQHDNRVTAPYTPVPVLPTRPPAKQTQYNNTNWLPSRQISASPALSLRYNLSTPHRDAPFLSCGESILAHSALPLPSLPVPSNISRMPSSDSSTQRFSVHTSATSSTDASRRSSAGSSTQHSTARNGRYQGVYARSCVQSAASDKSGSSAESDPAGRYALVEGNRLCMYTCVCVGGG